MCRKKGKDGRLSGVEVDGVGAGGCNNVAPVVVCLARVGHVACTKLPVNAGVIPHVRVLYTTASDVVPR